MSVFNLITWWSGKVSDSGRQEDGCLPPPVLCVSRFNSFNSATDSVERDTIFVGSATGMLSIYQPSDVHYITGHSSPTDVILEWQMRDPIIDLKCAKFAMTKSDKYSIAVLHPDRVTCYGVSFAEGLAEYGKQFRLDVVFESALPSPSFGLCPGNFGGVKSSFFCVSSLMTNELRFFEQDGKGALGVLATESSLPAKVLFLSRTDCFVLMSMPSEVLECYKYQDLITSTKERPAVPVWSFGVGEFILEMATHQISNSESVVLLLGEHNLICVTDGGVIKFIKKLDYTALTFHSFVIGYYFEPDARLMIAIVSDMQSIFVYECSGFAGNGKLIWSAQLPFVPVALSRATFEGMPGGLVLLSETGQIVVGFFGTEHQNFKVPPLQSPNENLESVHKELERLEGDIKEGIDFTDVSYINAACARDLEVEITVGLTVISTLPEVERKISPGNNDKLVRVLVKLSPKVPFEQLLVTINPPPPLATLDPCVMLMDVEAEKQLNVEFFIYLGKCDLEPPALTTPLLISMINRNERVPRVLEKTFNLPAQMLLQHCAPQKEGRYKLTVTLENSQRDLQTLFPEFAQEIINQHALGLQSISTGSTATVVLGKKSFNRYLVQSDSMSLIPVVIELLTQRLLKPPNPNSSQSSIKDTISINQSSFFADDLRATIELHASNRRAVKDCDKEIQIMSRQMRLFQRKLMLMLQQDPPHPSYNSAGKLLRLTHADLQSLQAKLLSAVDQLQRSQLILGNHLRFLELLINHSKIPPQIKDSLCAVFVNPITDWIDLSWEESLAPALEMMTQMGPLGKHGNSDIEDVKTLAQLPFDMKRFLKNLTYLLDKLEAAAESDYEELLEKKELPARNEEPSDWLVDADNAPVHEEDEQISSDNYGDLV